MKFNTSAKHRDNGKPLFLKEEVYSQRGHLQAIDDADIDEFTYNTQYIAYFMAQHKILNSLIKINLHTND